MSSTIDERSRRRVYLGAFLEDAARWVRPEEVAGRSEVTPWVIGRLLWQHPSLRAMAWFRFGSWAKAAGIRGASGLVQRRIARRYGLEISIGASVAGGLYVAHPYGTTISAERIGRNVTVVGSVTVGLRGGPGRPRVGDGVYLGAGARVLGDIDVGDGAVVGANAVVVKHVAPCTTVVGVPARPLSTGRSTGHGSELASSGAVDG